MESVARTLDSRAATEKFGAALGALLMPGDCVGLTGDLGAGKTFLTRAVCKGAGLPDDVYVASPTFALINDYRGARLPLLHVDLYRIVDRSDLYALGWDDLVESGAALIVEWADRVTDALPPHALWIHLEVGDAEDARRLTLRAQAGRGLTLVAELSRM